MSRQIPYPILISACLAGLRTRYDGRSKMHHRLNELRSVGVLVPVCPEILGGLGIPRIRCFFRGGDGRKVLEGSARVVDANGVDRTEAFVRGAEEVVRVVELVSPKIVIFKEGSPSCGFRMVDIEGTRRQGCGVVTALLLQQGIPIISEEDDLSER